MANRKFEMNDHSDNESEHELSEKASKFTPTLYGYEDDIDYKYKYHTLKMSVVGLICLLIGIIIGGLCAIQLFRFFQQTQNFNTNTNIIHNDDFSDSYSTIGSLMGKIRSKIKKRAARRNEDECASRRCCSIRDELKQSELPTGLKCKSLSDEECGAMDEYCIWDCNPPINIYKNNKIRKHFRKISLELGTFTLPTEIKDGNTNTETFEECLDNEATLISIDDCGVEYEEELDEEERIIFCQYYMNNLEDASKKGGKPFGDESGELLRRRLDVIGSDDRLQINSTEYPWSAVMYMNFDKPTGAISRCTATMISPHWAITAAHCVYGTGDFYSDWKLYKNVLISTDKDCEHQFTTNLRVIFSSYANGSIWDYDIAWLRVTETIMNKGELYKLGYFDFGYDSRFGGEEYFNIISYPADKSYSTKWYQYCPYNNPWYTHQMVTYECDTYGGASGSLIYKYWPSLSGGTRIIYGIHAKGACYLENGTLVYRNYCNTGTRITPGKYYAICNYVELNNPYWCKGIRSPRRDKYD